MALRDDLPELERLLEKRQHLTDEGKKLIEELDGAGFTDAARRHDAQRRLREIGGYFDDPGELANIDDTISFILVTHVDEIVAAFKKAD